MADINSLTNLVTSEYVECPKFKAVLSLLLGLIQNVSDLNHDMSVMMNLDNASGEILDLIGSVVGISRQVDFQPTTGSSILDDEHYKTLIKVKIIKNQWDGTLTNLYTMWDKLFPNNPIFVIDGQDMTAEVVIFGLSGTLYQELITHGYIIPKPSGVKYTYRFAEDVTFSFDLNTDLLKGWDLGKWLNLEE